MSGTTEDSILGSIPDFQDDSTGGDSGASDSSPAQTSTQPSQGGDEGTTTSAQPTQSGGEGGGTQQPQTVRRRHDGLIEQPNPDNPNTRDLVDPITGRTVAKGGIERRVYEEGQRHARENNQLKQQLGACDAATVASINEVTQEAVRLNVAPQDQVIAIRVMADFMRDPVKTLASTGRGSQEQGLSDTIPWSRCVSPGYGFECHPAHDRQQDRTTDATTSDRAAKAANAATGQADLDTFLEDNEEANSNLDVLEKCCTLNPVYPSNVPTPR